MPYTYEELTAVVDGLVTDRISPSTLEDLRWADSTAPTAEEFRTIRAMYGYTLWYNHRNRPIPQRKAMRLLRTLLSPEQRRTLRAGRYFYVTTRSGATFRFWPRAGSTDRVARHGTRWYSKSSFCLHDAENDQQMPPADLVIAHLLLISADEAKFLEMANEHKNRSQLWNGEYMREMRQARIERESRRIPISDIL